MYHFLLLEAKGNVTNCLRFLHSLPWWAVLSNFWPPQKGKSSFLPPSSPFSLPPFMPSFLNFYCVVRHFVTTVKKIANTIPYVLWNPGLLYFIFYNGLQEKRPSYQGGLRLGHFALWLLGESFLVSRPESQMPGWSSANLHMPYISTLRHLSVKDEGVEFLK